MGFYSRHILPFCLDKACGIGPIEKQRAKIVPQAKGRVVEIGIGSGHNLPFYKSEQVSSVIGVEPDECIWKRSQSRRKACAFPVTRLGLSGVSIPLEDRSADTVVVTYSLCTIPNPVLALREMKRIVKADGQILFCEHGQAPDPGVHTWQKRIDPVWKKIAGGCHSGRDIPALLREANLSITQMEEMYTPGPKVLSYNYWGAAMP
ncbi:class I SAM-dependent methyltransferase [Litorimonas haliclonae]|uniref:class I SAM-dependent methyltransferase n=1 Tax=Litorimonas haliclonae TaxID=2081977 RepID=UPI0039F0760C